MRKRKPTHKTVVGVVTSVKCTCTWHTTWNIDGDKSTMLLAIDSVRGKKFELDMPY